MYQRFIIRLISFLYQKLKTYNRQQEQILVFSNDNIGEEIFINGVYEKDQIIAIINSLDFELNSYNCIDVGANIGNHSIQFSKYFKNVFSFEPNNEVYEVLKLNTRNRSNIFINNFGLSNKNYSAYINFGRDNFGKGYISEEISRKLNSQEVELRKYDEIFDEEISFVKIDVEGHEFSVIEGMEKMIIRDLPIIAFEYQKDGNSDCVYNKLKTLGYDKFYIQDDIFIRKIVNPTNLLFKLIRFISYVCMGVKHKLILLDEPKKKFYALIVAENKNSKFRLKKG